MLPKKDPGKQHAEHRYGKSENRHSPGRIIPQKTGPDHKGHRREERHVEKQSRGRQGKSRNLPSEKRSDDDQRSASEEKLKSGQRGRRLPVGNPFHGYGTGSVHRGAQKHHPLSQKGKPAAHVSRPQIDQDDARKSHKTAQRLLQMNFLIFQEEMSEENREKGVGSIDDRSLGTAHVGQRDVETHVLACGLQKPLADDRRKG